MKIKLIHPAVGKINGEKYVKSWTMYPLNLGVIASLTPKDVEVEFIDDRFENISYDSDCDLVGLPVETYTAKRAYSISEGFRRLGVKTVLGGVHPTLMPQEAMLHSDAIVVGDAEKVWETLINDAKKGLLKKVYSSQREGKELFTVKPDRSLFDMGQYLPIDLIETGRGCFFSCDFCAVTAANQRTYRTKTVEDIIGEIQSVKRKNLYLVDDNFVSDFKRTKDLCEAMAQLGVRWTGQGSVNMADDEKLLHYLERSGCFNMLIGFESLNPKSLELMGKSWTSSKRKYEESIKKIRDHGITIYATFVFGYDTDTKDDFKRTIDFAIDQKFAITAFNHLVPFPGTPLYSRLKDQGRLLYDDWWLRDGGKFGEAVFRPKNMTPQELTDGCFGCREAFYQYGSISHRLFDFKANFKNPLQGGYVAWINLFSRHEAKKRQGWPIGDII